MHLSMLMILACCLWVRVDALHAEQSVKGPGLEAKLQKQAIERPQRYQDFIKGLSTCKIAIVKVEGMVCDYCARGIEKSFKKDAKYKKMKINLKESEVMIAYTSDKEIKFEVIKKHFKKNGQTATHLDVVELKLDQYSQ